LNLYFRRDQIFAVRAFFLSVIVMYHNQSLVSR
jgi:hypothetical protein